MLGANSYDFLPFSNLKKRKQEMTSSVKSLSDYCEIRNTIIQLALRSYFSNSVRGQWISTTLITLTEKLLTMWFMQEFCNCNERGSMKSPLHGLRLTSLLFDEPTTSNDQWKQERATCQLYTTRRAWSANPCAWKSIACEQARKEHLFAWDAWVSRVQAFFVFLTRHLC